MNRDEQVDVGTLLARLIQLDQLRDDLGAFDLPEFLWHRVMTCDVPRLRDYLTGDVGELLDQVTGDTPGRQMPPNVTGGT